MGFASDESRRCLPYLVARVSQSAALEEQNRTDVLRSCVAPRSAQRMSRRCSGWMTDRLLMVGDEMGNMAMRWAV